MNKNSKIYVAGHRGLAGSAIVRKLQNQGFQNIVTRPHAELDLTKPCPTRKFFEAEKPEYVFFAAAKVGGIVANDTQGADFIYQNLMIQNNVIHQSYVHGVKKLVFLGSSCIYPKLAPQPLKEEYLMTGPLEPTNDGYAVAKIAGIKMCQLYRKQYGCNFISIMPTNLYGLGDHYDLQTSHVFAAFIRKFHEAKVQKKPYLEIWGSGTPRREFMCSDDLADASLFLMEKYNSPEIINVGLGSDVTILELAKLVKTEIGYEGEIKLDPTKPDGTPQKLLDVSKINALGWKASISLEQGIKLALQDFLNNKKITEFMV